MFYRKSLKLKKNNSAVLTLASFAAGMSSDTDENILPLKYAALAYNYSVSSGALRDGLSALPFVLKDAQGAQADAGVIGGESVLRLWHYRRFDFNAGERDDRLVAYTESKKLFWRRLDGAGEFVELEGASFNGVPEGINYRLNGGDVLILCSDKENMMVWDGENYPYYVASSPFILSMDIHYERLFAIVGGERNSLWFSDDLDPTNWDLSLDNAGFIEMIDERGRMLKVISFLDYVYVFREFGISRVSAYADQESFAASQLFVSSGRIEGATVCVCGDRIIFLAEDGLYVFDGLSARAVLPNLKTLLKSVDKSRASAAFVNGKYYLACRLDYGDGEIIGCEAPSQGCVNNTILELDVKTFSCNLHRGIDAVHLCAVKTENRSIVAACVNDGAQGRIAEIAAGENLTGNLKRVWTTPLTDLGTPKTKLLKEVTLQSGGDMTLRISTERETKDIPVSGGLSRARIGLSGKLIRASFISEGDGVRIASPRLSFDILDR